MDKQKLIDGLNYDLAQEYTATIQYLTYAANVTGPYRPQISALFRQEITDELGHAQLLAEKIAALGGTPTTQPAPVPEATDAKQMLQRVAEAEEETVKRYTQRAAEAEQAGELALKFQLENIIVDETQHGEEVRKILENWR